MKSIKILLLSAFAFLMVSACQEKEANLLVENVKVSVGDRKITHRGATVDVTFKAPLSWAVRLELKNQFFSFFRSEFRIFLFYCHDQTCS